VEKYCRARQATDDNMAHAYCMLDNYGYRHTLRICNTYCFARQQWSHERASMLRYAYIASLPVNILLTSTMERIKRAILETTFSAELPIIIASYNIVQKYTLRICHIQRLMKRKRLKVRPLYQSASHQRTKTCGII
jgi:hypothetical protein